jgi:hypothetical protein
MFTAAFWRATAERAVKTFAQTLVALLSAGAFNVLKAEWQESLGVAAGAAVLSVLTSIASAGVGNSGPSLGPETVSGAHRRTSAP